MIINRYGRPFTFYALATAIPWAFWLAAAYVSHMPTDSSLHRMLVGVLGVLGLLGPTVIAFWMIWPHPDLRMDLRNRLIGLKRVKPVYLLLTCFLMPASILLAQAISLAFGHSADQFRLSNMTSFSAGIFPGWFLLFLAPLVEELAWHSYGTDSLRQRMNLFWTSILFGVYWAIWHMPLGLIKAYYHANVAETGLLYSLNFLVSLVPYVLIMNWLYYRSRRSILVAIIFHITAGVFNELFQTHPDSKVIQTGLLLVFAVVIVIKERDFFFKRELVGVDAPSPVQPTVELS